MSDKEKKMETVTAAAENEEESMLIVFKNLMYLNTKNIRKLIFPVWKTFRLPT